MINFNNIVIWPKSIFSFNFFKTELVCRKNPCKFWKMSQLIKKNILQLSVYLISTNEKVSCMIVYFPCSCFILKVFGNSLHQDCFEVVLNVNIKWIKFPWHFSYLRLLNQMNFRFNTNKVTEGRVKKNNFTWC